MTNVSAYIYSVYIYTHTHFFPKQVGGWFHLSVDSKVKNSLMSKRQIFFIGNVIWQRVMRGFPSDQYDATIMFSYVFLYTSAIKVRLF